MTLGIDFSVYTHLRLWGFMIKPSPAGEGWVRGNQQRKKLIFIPLIPAFSLREKGQIFSKVKQHQTIAAPHTQIMIT